MKFILYDVVKLLKDISYSSTRPLNDERVFNGVELLSASNIASLSADKLYVSLDTDLQVLSKAPRDAVVLCLGSSRLPASLGTQDCTAVILDPTCDFAGVINSIFNFETSLSYWVNSMDCAIAANSSLQQLLDISEPYFNDPIIVMSKTLRVLACTRHIPASNPDVAKTLQDGYFPRNMVRGLIENHYLEAAEQFRNIGYHYPPNYVNCTKIIKVFDDNSMQVHTICLYGLSADPTPDVMSRMKLLVDYIQKLINKNHSTLEVSRDSRQICSLADILDKTLTKDELDSKSVLLGWSNTAHHRLCTVSFSRCFYPYVQYVTNCLQAISSFTAVFFHDHQIIILEELPDSDGTVWDDEDERQKLAQLFSENDAVCGVSEAFSRLEDAKAAYRQAQVAARLGTRLDPGSVIYSYRKYGIYHLLELSSEKEPLQDFCSRELQELRHSDAEHGNNNLLLLRTLLENDRSITAVAQKMHMHRNSVLYRVDRLQQRLNVSLDDPYTRLMLQTSIMAMELMDSTKQGAAAVN